MKNNKGEVTLIILIISIFAFFGATVRDGIAKQQWEKMKASHNAPITVDKDTPTDRGFAK